MLILGVAPIPSFIWEQWSYDLSHSTPLAEQERGTRSPSFQFSLEGLRESCFLWGPYHSPPQEDWPQSPPFLNYDLCLPKFFFSLLHHPLTDSILGGGSQHQQSQSEWGEGAWDSAASLSAEEEKFPWPRNQNRSSQNRPGDCTAQPLQSSVLHLSHYLSLLCKNTAYKAGTAAAARINALAFCLTLLYNTSACCTHAVNTQSKLHSHLLQMTGKKRKLQMNCTCLCMFEFGLKRDSWREARPVQSWYCCLSLHCLTFFIAQSNFTLLISLPNCICLVWSSLCWVLAKGWIFAKISAKKSRD